MAAYRHTTGATQAANIIMRRIDTALFCTLITVLGPIAAIAAPIAKIVSDEKGSGCPYDYPFQEDKLKIVISEGNKVLAEKPICSSYAGAEAVIEKDATGIYFLLLRYGKGRGTNARSEFLSIYKLGRNLIEHVRIPISEPASSTGKWHYDYQVLKPKSGGLRISLTLRIDSERDVEFAPSDKRRTIEVR